MIFQAGSKHDNGSDRNIPKLILPDRHTESTQESILPGIVIRFSGRVIRFLFLIGSRDYIEGALPPPNPPVFLFFRMHF